MNTRTATITATVLAAAALFVAIPSAVATPTSHPDPGGVTQGASQYARVVQLLQDGRHATAVAERRLVHLELIQTLRDGE